MNRRFTLVAIAGALLVPFAVWGSDVTLPFTFQSGTPIRASEMNDNFSAVKTAVAALGAVRSGTRLKSVAYVSADGFSSPVGIWDDQLKTSCSVTGSQRYCVPQSVSALFTSSACTPASEVGVVLMNSAPFGLASSDAGTKFYFVRGFIDGGYELKPVLNPQPSTQPLYGPSDFGPCQGLPVGPALIGPLGNPLSHADLARLEVGIQ